MRTFNKSQAMALCAASVAVGILLGVSAILISNAINNKNDIKNSVEIVETYSDSSDGSILPMINLFKSLEDNGMMSFKIYYEPMNWHSDKEEITLKVDYNGISHEEVFYNYEDFKKFISSREYFYDNVVNVRNKK